MALPAQSYVWPRVQHIAAAWVENVTGLASGQVLWADQNQPRPALPYAGLERREFPFETFDDETIIEVPTQVTLTVTASASGETVAVLLFGLRYAYTMSGADTTQDARDALLTLISADLARSFAAGDGHVYGIGFQPCTATAASTDQIVFAGLGLAPVHVTATEGGTLATDTLAYRHVTSGMRRAIVRVHLFWPERQTAFETVAEYSEVLRSSLLTESTATWLAARGLGVDNAARISVQDASVASGGARERRKFLDVVFNAASKVYTADDGIVTMGAISVEILS